MKRLLALLLAAAAPSLAADTPAGPPPGVPPHGASKASGSASAPLPAHYQQMRAMIAELYPDAAHLPVIWDEAHDPFRYAYNDEEPTEKDEGETPAAAPPKDLDTQSLIEAGLDMMGGKGKPKAGAAATTRTKTESMPTTDAELLKRAVGKLRIGGVFVLKGVSRLLVDSVQRVEGDVIAVSVAGKRVNVLLEHLNPQKATFVISGVGDAGPQVTIKF